MDGALLPAVALASRSPRRTGCTSSSIASARVGEVVVDVAEHVIYAIVKQS